VNIWGNPAENFAMPANRGQEIFVETSLRQEKQEESVLKVLGCWLFCQLWEELGLRKFWQQRLW
jgi:hypothetical protein